ncbi:MAG TPA: ADP-ribosylglycohydrolase family protein [Candidatus Sulfomarinibacteraceae bacterium]|nr:ADP-ribosylglycohydrolase family protein [Candidatus Sulfomarinibacteraceae bacterium]
MLGAIAGDVIGSVYEARPIKRTDFPLFGRGNRFTDDTVLTVAVAYAILESEDYGAALKRFARRYPNAGYGGSFIKWIFEPEVRPYNSWGNGSAMRVSPVGFAFDDENTVLRQARRSAEVSHNHPEGIKGAQATAQAVLLARQGAGRQEIREALSDRFGYDLQRTVAQIRPHYRFDVSCQGSVPEAIIAFLDSEDYEHAVRLAISLGGDADTQACIAGAIAHAYYREVPAHIAAPVQERLPEDLLAVVQRFNEEYGL